MALNNEENLRRLKFDLNGSSGYNRVLEEHLRVDFPNSPYVIPAETPFFEEGVELLNAVTMTPLVEGVDYRLVILATKATMDTGLSCWSAIEIVHPESLRDVYIRYQSVGGHCNDNLDTIRDLLARVIYNQNQAVYWDNVQNKPIYYSPDNHTHPLYEVNGLNALNNELERLVGNLFSTPFQLGVSVDLSVVDELERHLNRHVLIDTHGAPAPQYLSPLVVSDTLKAYQTDAVSRVVPAQCAERIAGKTPDEVIEEVLGELDLGQLRGRLAMERLAPTAPSLNHVLVSDGVSMRWVDIAELMKGE